nr:hypothetical protein Itr_chr03CG12620 [Ipomoea trifida]
MAKPKTIAMAFELTKAYEIRHDELITECITRQVPWEDRTTRPKRALRRKIPRGSGATDQPRSATYHGPVSANRPGMKVGL